MAIAPTESSPSAESVWTKYSPNHEFPLASATSVVLHGLLFAGVLLGGFALNSRWHGETSLPPKMTIAYIQATVGDGLPPGGGAPATVGGAQVDRTDTKQPLEKPIIDSAPLPRVDPIVPMPMPMPDAIDIPSIGEDPKPLELDAKIKAIQGTIQPNATNPPKSGGTVGKGSASVGGKGTGTGAGVGPGSGIGGLPGGGATRADILAQRWRFNLTGSPREHVQKLIAIGMTLGFMDGGNNFYRVQDLRKRPVAFKLEPFDNFKDTVKWGSENPLSVLGLSRELGLPAPPARFILLLPKEREQMIADAEFQFAASRNRDLGKVQESWFDFRLRAGVYEPVVIGQVPYDPRPKW